MEAGTIERQDNLNFLLPLRTSLIGESAFDPGRTTQCLLRVFQCCPGGDAGRVKGVNGRVHLLRGAF